MNVFYKLDETKICFYLNFYKLSFIVAKTNSLSVTLGAQLYLWRTNSRQTRHELVTDGQNIGGMVSILQF